MPKIRPLSLDDRHLVSSALRSQPPMISELTFSNLFGWRQGRPVYVTEIMDSLVFLIDGADKNDARKILFGPPVGAAQPSAVLDALSNSLAGAVRMPENVTTACREIGLTVKEDRDNADYVYLKKDLAELTGRKFAKKRNQIKLCLQMHACEYEPVIADNLEECKAMQEHWCGLRNCIETPGLCSEYAAIMETLGHYEKFGLIGGAIRINGKIEAYSMGEQLTPDTAVVHFEKAMPEYQGLGQLINNWFARYGLEKFTFINREQDLGIPGLRQAKESYYPHHLVMKYTASLPDAAHLLPPPVHACPDAEN